MKISKSAFELALANNQMSIDELIDKAKCSSATIHKAQQGKDILPRTVGRLAKALSVEPCDILATD